MKAENGKVYHNGKRIADLGSYSIDVDHPSEVEGSGLLGAKTWTASYDVVSIDKEYVRWITEVIAEVAREWGHLATVTIKRTWKQRLFSWPWRPWHPYLVVQGVAQLGKEPSTMTIDDVGVVRTQRKP